MPKPKMFTEKQMRFIKTNRDYWKEKATQWKTVSVAQDSQVKQLKSTIGQMYSEQQYQDLLNLIRSREGSIIILEKELSLKESMLGEVCKQRDEARKSVESLSKDLDQSCMDIAELAENYNTLLLAFQNSAKLLEQK